MNIIQSILGRKIGLGTNDELIINRGDGLQEVFGLSNTVTISSAELLALNATPKILIAAQGPGLAIVPKRAHLYKPAGTAYAGIAAGDDLAILYAGNAICLSTTETTGFLDQSTDQVRMVHPLGATGTTPADFALASNTAVVMQLLSGPITTGNTPLKVRIWYDVIPVYL